MEEKEMTYEVRLVYGYEVKAGHEVGAVTEAFIEHMKELNSNPRPIVDIVKLKH